MGEIGVGSALEQRPALSRGTVYVGGKLKNEVVAELTGEPQE